MVVFWIKTQITVPYYMIFGIVILDLPKLGIIQSLLSIRTIASNTEWTLYDNFLNTDAIFDNQNVRIGSKDGSSAFVNVKSKL